MRKGILTPLGLDIFCLPMTKSGPGEAASRERRQTGAKVRCLTPNRRFEGRRPALGIGNLTCVVIKEVGEASGWSYVGCQRPATQDKSFRKRAGSATQQGQRKRKECSV